MAWSQLSATWKVTRKTANADCGNCCCCYWQELLSWNKADVKSGAVVVVVVVVVDGEYSII